MPDSPLKSLHSDAALSQSKLAELSNVSTEVLLSSLEPGQDHSLKLRPDGTILDGHHDIKVLPSRGVDVDALPREIVARKSV
jgi:hypothetical protein